MKTSHLSLSALLLATTALLAPQVALAQAASPAAETEVEELTVLGRFIPDVMRETSEVSSVLTIEDLKRAGDDTAAVALTRMSGLSLVSGRFVYVRGLGERYSSALLNGSPLPSPEPLQRVVPLDLFPSNILASTVVQKTYSASYPGEFGGGVIDLKTISTPVEPFFSFGFSVGANSETTQKDGLTYYGSDTDWTGYDDGARETPGPLAAALADRKRLTDSNFTPAQLQTIGQSFNNAPMNLLQKNSNIDFDYSVDVSAGRTFDLGFGTLGLIAVAGFDNAWRTRVGIQQEGFVQAGNIEVRTDYDYRSTQNDIVLNGLLGASLQWGDHEVKWTNFYVHSTTKEARSRVGYDDLAGANVRDDYTEWFERSLSNTQLVGAHEFGQFEIDWRAAYARSTRDAPYEKGIRYRLVNGVYEHNASQEQNYTRFSEVEDTVASAGIDFKYTVPLSDAREAILSGGLAYSDNDRHAEAREYRFLALNNSLPQDVRRQRVDYLLSDFNIGPNLLVVRETTGSEGAAAYRAALEVQGAYAQVDAEVLPLVRAAVGIRYEDATQSVTPVDLFGGVPPVAPPALENQYWLPAATVTWNFAEDMQLRLGASKTIARPQFRELAPQQYLDPELDRLFIGNPYLVDTELLNFDARYEWYFDSDQFVTLGVFYKDLEKPVEAVVNESGATVQQTYINAPKARLYGAEVEIKKYFDPVMETGWLASKRWLVGLNYTYSKSEVQVEAGDLVYPLAGGGSSRLAQDYVKDGSALQGQSEHLANAQFGYEDEEAQSQATLLVTYVGDRISARGRPGQPDLIQSPGVMLDFTYRKTVTVRDHDLQLGLKARNLLGEDYEEFQELGAGKVYANQYEMGRSLSVSVSTKF
ncbi:MAG: TonB-dependent receptor [Phenylobacterium sp.]|uniref:TonB-dependent receptor domain-containing protein n=1 Tax=Phenylobacterium sp. TaxID=1871053 RepID=UPI00271974F6|nr:TonB-dependent receptor [Phenylobacterium sp.]MDO8910588.1 TonB-dependent receptor [Phenylobacterium sp.]MDP3102335.1 TonB-dependent receptor [Phenylobacterium sp.]